MLQQTTVVAVKPYFAAFTQRWPTVQALANAADSDVMAAWAGLGYYARARNLLACARAVTRDQGGVFPDSQAALRALPGIGAYTAAAIAAIAFGQRAVVVDGNVERVIARLFAVDALMPAAKPALRARMDQITPQRRAGDFAQAMMDLGSSLCLPRRADCLACPLRASCQGASRDPTGYPRRLAKLTKPERSGVVWWIEKDDAVYLVRRPAKGLLGGMRAFPSGGWDGADVVDFAAHACVVESPVIHVFTHFRLALSVRVADAKTGCKLPPDGEWWPIDRLNEAGLPSVFIKVARVVREDKSHDADRA